MAIPSEYKIDFWSSNRLNEFWEMVEELTKFSAPGIMIYVAITLVGFLLIIVVRSFKQATKNENDDDEDFDIKHY